MGDDNKDKPKPDKPDTINKNAQKQMKDIDKELDDQKGNKPTTTTQPSKGG